MMTRATPPLIIAALLLGVATFVATNPRKLASFTDRAAHVIQELGL